MLLIWYTTGEANSECPKLTTSEVKLEYSNLHALNCTYFTCTSYVEWTLDSGTADIRAVGQCDTGQGTGDSGTWDRGQWDSDSETVSTVQ